MSRTAMVRDAAAPRYGDARPRNDAAAVILRDLARARDARAAGRIVARYAVARFWLLGSRGAPPALLDHARESAYAYLEPVETGWAEGALLRRLMGRPEPLAAAVDPVLAAAWSAERAGEPAGAYGLRLAAHQVAIARLDYARAAALAREMAAFVRRRGAAGAAGRWAARAGRYDAAAALTVAPSVS